MPQARPDAVTSNDAPRAPRSRGVALVPAALTGVAGGISGGLFGVGGGVVMVPLLNAVFGLTQHQAHGTSLAIMGLASTVAFSVYAFHGNVSWMTALIAGLASTMTARWGARLAARTPAGRLAIAFALLLVVLAIRLLWKTPHAQSTLVSGAWAIPADLAVGAAVGVLAGYFGVGGGVLAVPAFTLLLGMTQHVAQGTSLGLILFTAPAGAIEHRRLGHVVMPLVWPCAFGAALGGLMASSWAQHLSAAILARGFALFALANAVRLILKQRPARSRA